MKVDIELDDSALKALSYLKDPITTEPITIEDLLQVLVNDLGYTQTRPGSWEGLNMKAVIDGHGWEMHLQK